MRKLSVLVVGVVLLCGCAMRQSAVPTDVSEGILTRTGHSIPPFDHATRKGKLPPGLDLGRPLSSDAAAAIALWNNLQFAAALSSLGIAEADVIDAGLLRNPRLDLLFPVGAKPFELLLAIPVDAFWQRARRVAAAERAYERVAQILIQSGLDTARDGRLAHADLVSARQRQRVGVETANLRQRIAELTEARLQAGAISELEVVSARAEAGSAREQRVRFEHEAAIAGERLRQALGLTEDRRIEVAIGEVSMTPPPAIDVLLEKAMMARPDLRAAELAVAAATQRAKWERSRIVVLTAELSSKEVGTNGVLSGPGLSVELPIFNRNQGLIARADREIEMASLQYLALKQQIAFEVYQAREQLLEAQEALGSVREQVLVPLRRGAEIAEQQYQRGDVSYLFVLEQNRSLVDAQLRVIDLEGAVSRAQAQLERNVGSR